MFQSDSSSKYYKEIPLPEILNIVSHKSGNTKKEVYLFEIRTKNVTYFIGEDSSTANTWEKHLRQALMPVPSTSDPVTDKNGKPVNSSNSVNHVPQEYPEEEEEQNDDLSHQYQIFIDQVLGAGQFGTVFSGVHRTSHRDVAIKVINKLRFPTKQEAQLKNEVSILQNISHPGVVNLEKMYETPENIFVVMERLSGDMLDMILTSEGSKLSEGVTKFLIYQVNNISLDVVRFFKFNFSHRFWSHLDICILKIFVIVISSPKMFCFRLTASIRKSNCAILDSRAS